MAKKRSTWSEREYLKRIKEGRGQGTGMDYKPWITIHDFPSRGIVTRILGFKTGRLHHLLSGLESDYFLILDHTSGVVDIREQYPLILEDTLELARAMNIRHPRLPGIEFPYVMTTDFLITMEDGTLVARAVKPSKDLEDKRTCEKLMLEREYWVKRGIDWKIVTEKEINSEKAMNLRWLYYGASDYDSRDFSYCEGELLSCYHSRDIPFPTALEIIEEAYSLSTGTGMSIFKHLVREGKVVLDLERRIDPLDPRKNDISDIGSSIGGR